MTAALDLLRERVASQHPSWRLNARRIETDDGPRYAGTDVVDLLRPALAALGIHRVPDPASGAHLLTTADGHQITTDSLRHLLLGALGGIEDRQLITSLRSASLYWHLRRADFPTYAGKIKRSRRSPLPVEVPDYFAEYVAAWIAANVTEVRPAPEAFREFADDFADDFGDRPGEDGHPGRESYYKALRASGLVEERRRAAGVVLVPLDVVGALS